MLANCPPAGDQHHPVGDLLEFGQDVAGDEDRRACAASPRRMSRNSTRDRGSKPDAGSSSSSTGADG
jgi:hypothetical protein